MAALTVGGVTAQPGETVTGWIDVPDGVDAGTRIPVSVVHGARPGPVLALAGQPTFVTTEHGRRMVADRLLASRVEVALAAHPATRRYQVEVKASGGLVTLVGCGAALEAAREATRGVPGLLEIKPVIVETPPVPPFVA